MSSCRLALLSLSALLTGACGSIDAAGTPEMLIGQLQQEREVYFFGREREDKAETVKLYVDRRGALYPRSGLPRTFLPADDPDQKTWSLRQLMHYNGATVSKLCEAVDQEPFGANSDAARLCNASLPSSISMSTQRTSIGCPLPDAFLRWQEIQNDLWRSAAEDIAKRAHEGGATKSVVILIHGFNVAQGDADFAAVKADLLATARDKNVLFVEIHWDGGLNTRSWGYAQYSGQIVGISLRRLLYGIRHASPSGGSTPIRLITHSSGAFVLGALVGDSREPNGQFQHPIPETMISDKDFEPSDNLLARCAYTRIDSGKNTMADAFSVPSFSSIRALLFAAATPSTTFGGSPNKRRFEGVLAPNLKMLVAINPRDNAINKLGWGAQLFGSTQLGSQRYSFCNLQTGLKRNPTPGVEAYGFDFEREDNAIWPTPFEKNTHSWPLYSEQALRPSTPMYDLLMNASDAELAALPSHPEIHPSLITGNRCA